MDEEEFAELAAGAALNALSPADREAFEAARRRHPEWQHLVDADAATAAALADTVSDALPPLTLRSTLLARVAATPQLPTMDASAAAAAEPVEAWSDSDEQPAAEPPPATAVIQAVSRQRWTRGILGLAASLVLLVALGLGAATLNDYLNRSAEVVALEQIEDAPDAQSATVEVTDGGTATAHWSESVGKVVLVSQGLPRIADDESFELWFVRGDDAVSAGTFESADGQATALLDGEVEPGDVIAVTIEPQGGSPTGEPSSEPIVIIPTA
ncbi:anti-sigma factor [Microbacterium sp. B35-30]|uniref:anti-sigma factor n=1 Tax=Microbacterium sp. B35-30 TaxID=1962642 RepID=UPI0013D6333C|nr:anti-sigma factor [Microbacterium sp. B35-30]KAF2415824.1 anti-sigma factor [Microbacterium sp. B35-30]